MQRYYSFQVTKEMKNLTLNYKHALHPYVCQIRCKVGQKEGWIVEKGNERETGVLQFFQEKNRIGFLFSLCVQT